MKGFLGPYSVSPTMVSLLPLMVLTGSVGLTGGVLTWLGRWSRRRSLLTRAERLESVSFGPAVVVPVAAGVGLDGVGQVGLPQGGFGSGGLGRRTGARLRRGTGRLRPVPEPTPRAGRSRRGRSRAEVVPAGLVGLLVGAMVGGPVGLLAGVLTAVAVRYWLMTARSTATRDREREAARLLAQLPLTAELLAACLSSSASPAQAVAVVARTVGGPMRARLAGVSAELLLGAPPALCWERVGNECPALAPLARCLVRTSVSGAPPAASLVGLALTQRAAAGRAAHARVRRAGVLATAPLGLCFLPAFVLIGIVPVVMGLAASFAHRL